MNKKIVFNSKLFIKLFIIPYVIWFIITLLAMIPDETNSDPLTWGNMILANIVILIIWLGISFIISLFVSKIIQNKSKSEKNKSNIKDEKIIVKTKDIKKYDNSEFIKKIMIILFILTIFSLWGALMSFALINEIHPQHGFNVSKNAWVFWCWLPIPLTSIILGFIFKGKGLKCTKNIIAGFILSFWLSIFGTFCIFPTFSQDYSNINNYKEYIDANLPSNGELEIINNVQTYSDDGKTEYSIINAYYDKEDISDLVYSIEKSNNWILSTKIKSELKILLPSLFTSSNNIYYSIYNKTTNKYNTIPDESGKYEIYAMNYDKSIKQLSIHKFNYIYNK